VDRWHPTANERLPLSGALDGRVFLGLFIGGMS
jgi:hypothetical protein